MENWTKPRQPEEVPAHVLAWQEETAHIGGGNWDNPDLPMAVDICYFIDGRHYPGELCPHGNEEYPPGWTV